MEDLDVYFDIMKLRRRVATAGMALAAAGAAAGLAFTFIPGSSTHQKVSKGRTPLSTVPSSSASCPQSPFVVKSPAIGSLAATPDFTTGAYRHLDVGQTAVLFSDRAPGEKSITLTRGVDNDAFAISVWSHGPMPLTPVTVLGSSSLLYPAGDGEPGPRIPFRYPMRVAQSDACGRYQLQALGVDNNALLQIATSIEGTAAPQP